MSLSIRAGSAISLPSVPLKVKVIFVVCGSTVLALGFASSLWFRWKRERNKGSGGATQNNDRRRHYSFRGLNGEIPQLRSMPSALCVRCRQFRDVDKGSITTLNAALPEQKEEFTPQEYGVMGMEALDIAIHYWEDAVSVFQNLPNSNGGVALMALPTRSESEFVTQLNIVMKQAFKLRDNTSKLFLDNTSLLFQIADDRSSIAGAHLKDFDRFDARTVTSFDEESFVSAEGDIANLNDFEDAINPDDLPLYQSALAFLKRNGVPARAIRTNLVNCHSDEEYLAKLYCVRLAFQHLTRQSSVRTMYIDAGSQILAGLLVYAEKDPKYCLEAYVKLIEWVDQAENRDVMERELRARGITALTIYDVVFDFLLIEAFDDLDDPPQSVVSVIQNRWLSASFRETALSTAIWSVIKAKKSRVKIENGFFTHFYNVAENLTPVLAWGFLGTNQDLRETCHHFKQEVMNLMIDVFDFKKVRYTSVEQMAEDIFGLSQLTVDRIAQRLGI